jgi:hypothetical protein
MYKTVHICLEGTNDPHPMVGVCGRYEGEKTRELYDFLDKNL